MIIDGASLLRSLAENGKVARDLVLKGSNIRGTDLAGLRADGLDLDEADLRESSLREVKWKGCRIRHARLEGADLTNAVLRLCDLDGTRASGATFGRARIENCTARGARLDHADLTAAVLTDTDFSRADLRGANLEGAGASGTDFRGADLRGAKLINAMLIDSDLRGADLTDADLMGADLRGADLRGAVGENVTLPKEVESTAELPVEMKALFATMAPIVAEVLQTAGRRGRIDAETTARLMEEVAALQRVTVSKNALDAHTVKAVARVLEELGDDIVPKLFAALRQPNQGGPPTEVRAMICRLAKELSLDESATAGDVLERLTKGL